MVVPKTIIVTGIPTKTANTVTLSDKDKMEINIIHPDVFEPAEAPRKRRRLTHLTPEERMLRRKLKNRVAAQTARDRKKAKMETLEEQMARMEAENKRLMEENQALLQQTSVLTTENSQLREKLGLNPEEGGDVAVKRETGSPVESAVLNNVLPQQEQIRALYQLTTSCMAYLMTLSLMTYSTCWSSSHQKARVHHQSPAHLLDHIYSVKSPQLARKQLEWWGPQQQSWNPSMN